MENQHKPPEERPVFNPMEIKLKDGVEWLFRACTDAFSSEQFKRGMVKCFYQVGLLRRPSKEYYDLYPTSHPDTYGKWVDSLRSTACVATYEDECKSFYFGDLFDELVLANFEACNAGDDDHDDNE